MEKLTHKKIAQYDYLSRYIGVPYYHDSDNDRDVYGIGEQLNRNVPFVSHKVVQGDNLDALALKYYNNPTYWWYIGYFNRINDPFIDLSSRYSVIRIPSLSSVEFKNER